MYSYFLRLNTIFFFSLTALLLLGLSIATQSYLSYNLSPNIIAHIDKAAIPAFQMQHRPFVSGERVHLSLDFSVDLRPLWHWNVKQIFLYIRADYEENQPEAAMEKDTDNSSGATKKKKKKKESASKWPRIRNRCTVADFIIESKEDSNINLTNFRSEYPLTDVHKNLRGAKILLSFEVDVMPIVGLLYTVKVPVESLENGSKQLGNYTIKLPNHYISNY
jgi:signal peptidase complex subunit 3